MVLPLIEGEPFTGICGENTYDTKTKILKYVWSPTDPICKKIQIKKMISVELSATLILNAECDPDNLSAAQDMYI